jgi:hypothetical protein
MADASGALGAPEIAGAWITRRGTAKNVTSTVAGAQGGGSRLLEVARARRGGVERFIAALGG